MKLMAKVKVFIPEEMIGESINFNLNLVLDNKLSKFPEHKLIWDETATNTEYTTKKYFRFDFKLTKKMKLHLKVQCKDKKFEGTFN